MIPASTPYTVETAIFHNRRFASWQVVGTFASKRDAWNWLKSRGYRASDYHDTFLAYPAEKVRDYSFDDYV